MGVFLTGMDGALLEGVIMAVLEVLEETSLQ